MIRLMISLGKSRTLLIGRLPRSWVSPGCLLVAILCNGEVKGNVRTNEISLLYKIVCSTTICRMELQIKASQRPYTCTRRCLPFIAEAKLKGSRMLGCGSSLRLPVRQNNVGGTRLQIIKVSHGGRHIGLSEIFGSSSSLALMMRHNARLARLKCMQLNAVGLVSQNVGGRSADSPAPAPPSDRLRSKQGLL
jgi:hypothetical protein